jgi:hypothetical protein
VQPNTHPAKAATVNIFIFMPPLNPDVQFDCKLFARLSLGKVLLKGGMLRVLLHELWLGSLTAVPASSDI